VQDEDWKEQLEQEEDDDIEEAQLKSDNYTPYDD
jgi:hypothetical protein